MPTAQHTPGPWSRGRNGDNCGDGLAIIGPDGCEVIAKVYGKGYPIGQGYHPVSEADAALIAAAPAMLAALEPAETIIADHVAGVERSAWPEVLHFIRAAIAQARGTPTGEPAHPTATGQVATGDAVALLRTAVEAWADDIDGDEPIAGSDAVEWLCGFIVDARNVLGEA